MPQSIQARHRGPSKQRLPPPISLDTSMLCRVCSLSHRIASLAAIICTGRKSGISSAPKFALSEFNRQSFLREALCLQLYG